MKDTKLREEIVRLARSLFDRGLTPGSSGNISLRLEDGGWLATPTNASLGSLDPARLSHLDRGGRLISGDPPTKELMLHAALYEQNMQPIVAQREDHQVHGNRRVRVLVLVWLFIGHAKPPEAQQSHYR